MKDLRDAIITPVWIYCVEVIILCKFDLNLAHNFCEEKARIDTTAKFKHYVLVYTVHQLFTQPLLQLKSKARVELITNGKNVSNCFIEMH